MVLSFKVKKLYSGLSAVSNAKAKSLFRNEVIPNVRRKKIEFFLSYIMYL